MRSRLVALALVFVVCAPAHALTSAEIDKAWNYDDPVASEQRFRAERARWPAGSRETLEIDTQIARTLGLQGRFDDANVLLDTVSVSSWTTAARGRALPPRARARREFVRRPVQAWSGSHALDRSADDRARSRGSTRSTRYMLGIAAPPGERVTWN